MLLMHFFIFIRFSNESNIFEYNMFFFSYSYFRFGAWFFSDTKSSRHETSYKRINSITFLSGCKASSVVNLW